MSHHTQLLEFQLINGLDILDSNITVDDFSGENRIVHLVISQEEMLELSQKLQNSNEIKFDITPKNENLLGTITENGQFKINLSWEPKKIESGIKTTFIFDILDVFLLDKPVSVNLLEKLLHCFPWRQRSLDS